MTTRPATHAGSWYTASSSRLSRELDAWLAGVGEKESKERHSKGEEGKTTASEAKESQSEEGGAEKREAMSFPIPGARVIIAPHAGYDYSGPTAAWAYKSLDLSNAKHIFLLGPSHKRYLSGCALSTYLHYATPLGDLKLDRDIIKELQTTKKFISWDKESEGQEHSLEMHLPYIYKMVSQQFKSDTGHPTIIPILVGSTSAASERLYGQILAPYLAKPTSIFIVSSDFCHWGLRFDYTRYIPKSGPLEDLEYGTPNPTSPFIYESIGQLDKLAMDAIEGGKHQDFLINLRETGNTVCGRHPIGVIMAALEVLQEEGKISGQGTGRFKFIQYKRSEDVVEIEKSSVSYASAVAIL